MAGAPLKQAQNHDSKHWR